MNSSNLLPKRGRSVKAAANMSDVKCAHIPRFAVANLNDEELAKLARLADKIRMRMNINQYVHGKKS
jgi:hypothetical protein